MELEKIPTRLLIHLKIMIRNAVKEGIKEYEESKNKVSNIPVGDFLTAAECASYLKISLNTVYSKVEKGQLPYYRSGKRKLLFSKEELQEYIKNRKA